MNLNITYKFDEFSLTASPLRLSKNNQLLSFTPKSLRILILLIKHKGQIVSKEAILKEVWQDSFISESVLAVNINTLRKILGKDLIKNIKREGYVFTGKVEVVFDEAINNITQNNFDDISLSFESFIGREKELRLLQLNFQSVSSNKGMAVFIGGEAGTGKTTLVGNFLEKISKTNDSIVLTASFFDFTGSNNESIYLYFKLLRQAFIQLNWISADFELTEENIAEVIKDKLRIEIPCDLFGQISGTNADDNKINRISSKLAECFLALSKKIKTIIYFDDIQWSDAFSLDLVGKLIRTAGNAPLVVLISGRIDDETVKIDGFNQWLEKHTKQNSFTKIELKPFSLEECGTFIDKIFGERKKIKSFTDADLFEIYQVTNGNPFFLKEYVYWLIADESVTRINNNSDWVFNRTGKNALPAGITSLVSSRINMIDDDVRHILEAACVAGEESKIKFVAEITNLTESEVSEALEICVGKGILTKQILNRGNDFRFRHNLLYRMFYESILPAKLFILHEKTAQVLEELYRNDAQKIANSVAQHYEAAQSYRKCLEWSLESAKYASNTEDWATIGKNIQRAEISIEKLGSIQEITLVHRYYFAFYKAYFLLQTQRDNELIPVLFEESINLARRLNDKEKLADAFYHYSRIFRLRGDVEKFIETLNEAAKVAEEANYQRVFWLAKKDGVIYEMLKGNYKMAAEKAKELPNNIGNEYLESKFTAILGEIYLFAGKYEEAKSQIIKTLNAFKKLGMDIEHNNTYSHDFVKYHIFTGKYQKAAGILEANADFWRAKYLESHTLYAELNRIQIRLAQGVISEAKQIAERILPEITNGSIFYLQYLLNKSFAHIYFFENNQAQAYKYIVGFKEKISKVDDFDLNAESELLFAKYNNKIGQTGEAKKHAKNALNFAIQAGSSLNEAFANIELAVSIKFFEPLDAIKTAGQAVRILETINSGEKWRAYFALAQIQLSTSSKLVKTKDIVENLEKTVYLLDEIRGQFDLNKIENLHYYEESTKNNCEPAKQLALIYQKSGDKESCMKIAEDWNLEF